MIHFCSYAIDNMSKSLEVCLRAAMVFGKVDVAHGYGPDDIDREFFENNCNILPAEKGAGFWLWKPYVVNKVMNEANDGDVVIYCDAGVEFITDVREIINVMDQDIFLFSNGHQHVHWCKADVIQAILGQRAIVMEMVEHQQVQASVIFIKVNGYTRSFIKEWLLWCQMPGFITDEPSKVPNHPEFAEHRYDQAILCCLQIKYGYKLHWWADKMWYENQRYRWPDDKYPSMFLHHRKRNHEWV